MVLAVGLSASVANADFGAAPLPVEVARRPLTLPADTVALELGLGLVETAGFGSTLVGGLRYAHGVHDDLELTIEPVSAALAPSQELLRPGLDLTYRPIVGWAELAVRAGASFPADPDRSGQLRLSVPMRFHIDALVRVDVLAELSAEVGPRTRTFLRGPLVITLQPHPLVFAGISGALRTDLDDWSTIAVAAGVHAGFTVPEPGGRPVLDVAASFGFPSLVEPFAADQVVTERWFLTLSGTGYFGVGAR